MIINLLKEKGEEFVLSEATSDRPLKVVIKRLPVFMESEELREDLELKGFQIGRISQLKNHKMKTPLPLFLVEVKKTETTKAFTIRRKSATW